MRNEYTIRVKSGSSKRKIENFGNNRYLVKVAFINHNDINKELIIMFSKYLGVPPGRIRIISGIDENDKILKIE